MTSRVSYKPLQPGESGAGGRGGYGGGSRDSLGAGLGNVSLGAGMGGDILSGSNRQALENREFGEVKYRFLESPLGTLLLVGSRRGILRVGLDNQDFDAILCALDKSYGCPIETSSSLLDTAARELAEYFSGQRREFDVSIDLTTQAQFHRSVQLYLPRIPYGDTDSYAHVAEALGCPRAARAVGTACALNPLPIILPCHRVLRADGSLGGYAGGVDVKQKLLALERAR